MKVTVLRVVSSEPTTLEEFADKHGLELELTERPVWTGKAPWEARFVDVSVMKSGFADASLKGWGNSPQEAVDHYCDLLRDKQVIVPVSGLLGLGSSEREVRCPEKWTSTHFIMEG